LLETVITALAYTSLLFAAVSVYLQLNKLWSRKHIEDVADSVSIPGVLVEAIPLLFFGLYFLQKGELLGIIDSVVWLFAAMMVVMIGSGFWVKGKRKKGFWQLVRDSVSKERAEITTLARQAVHPAAASKLLDVLTTMAAVDGVIDARERSVIEPFASDWNLTVDWFDRESSGPLKNRIIRVQEAVANYLVTTPPKSQAGHLLDILRAIIEADDEISEDEQTAFDEVSGALSQYLSEHEIEAAYQVLIAPQDTAQDEAIETMLSGVESHRYAGGKGYTVGHYFSRAYADVVCGEYRAMGFFTVVVEDGAMEGSDD
jgi:tellurite resistance protein